MRLSRCIVAVALIAAAASLAPACSGGDSNSAATNQCAGCDPSRCVNGVCVADQDGGNGDAALDGAGGTGGMPYDSGGCPPERVCPGACCRATDFCAMKTVCALSQPPCTTQDDCSNDSYCEAGTCLPYDLPSSHANDPSCKMTIDIGAIVPEVQCRWIGPPAGDAKPDNVHVMSTPMVVDFDFDNDPQTLHPSVVFTTFPSAGAYARPGVLRVIDGADCTQQFSFDGDEDATTSPASVAVGDLDGDGHAEIIAAAQGGGVVAFHYDPVTKVFARQWRSGVCSAGVVTPDATGGSDRWNGPSIHDLDDDGIPEVIYGATVYSADGCVKSSSLGFPAYSKGIVTVIADVDEDGLMELVLGNGIYEWSPAAADWVAESYFQGAGNAAGQVAVADFGVFPLASLGGQDRPEIAVISGGEARVQTIEGTIVFGPIALPGGGTGGLPTVADFDGDGRREFASAGGTNYVVFDLDCVAGGDPAGCAGQASTTGVLWTQPSKDASSNVTGSSVFDFDANGSAEAVYADECFLRIYEGATGKVMFSAARSSGTTYENPVIVDVDGDFRTEVVSAANDYAGANGCPSVDPLNPTVAYEQSHGIVILRDVQDRWASSRPVWNQHAYAVTNVGDRGEIPRTSQVKRNWADPSLNNFRQNVQGGLDALGVPDLTAGGDVGGVVVCQGTVAKIPARVCNRGTLPMVGGTVVGFYEGSETGPLLCSTPIPKALNVSECFVVTCEADLKGKTVDVYVKVDPNGETKECWENNNGAHYAGVACGAIPH